MDYACISNSILFCGIMERKRDGVVRSGWARRTFLLTSSALYYYRRTNENELLGEERGQIPLCDIISVKAMLEDQVAPEILEVGSIEYYYLEIVTKYKTIYMRVHISQASACESWCIAINEQRQNLLNMDVNKDKSLRNTAILGEIKNSNIDSYPEYLLDHFPSLQCISVVGSTVHQERLKRLRHAYKTPLCSTMNEWIVTHSVEWGKVNLLGVLPQGGACIITMKDGGTARIGTQALLSSWDSNTTCWTEVIGSAMKTSIEISAQCFPSNKKPLPVTTKPAEIEIIKEKERIVSLAYLEESAAIAFLILCTFVHILHDVNQFHWINRSCLTIAASLAILSICNNSLFLIKKHKHEMIKKKIKTPPPLPPDFNFQLTLKQCKINFQDKEYFFPTGKESILGV